MTEPVIIGDCTLYLGDCLEILPTLGRVDAVVTDPPYEAEAHGDMRRSRLNGIAVVDPLDFAPITDAQRVGLAAFCGQANGWSLVFCQAEAVTLWRDALNNAGARYKRAMVWCKPDSAPQFNGQGSAQGYESIVAAWSGDGASHWNGGGRRGFFVVPQGAGRSGKHKTEKPLSLISDLVRLFTDDAYLVADPFMGSGTTGVACAKMGRKFIGIELEPKYFDIACKRIEEAYRQPDMFVEQPKVFKQESML